MTAISCGSADSKETAEKPATNTEVEQPVIYTAHSVYVSPLRLKEEKNEGEIGKYTDETASFDLTVMLPETAGSHTVTVEAHNIWATTDTDPGKTEKIKEMLEVVKKRKGNEFKVTLFEGKVQKVFLEPTYTDKEGAVGEITSPGLIIYPFE